MLTSQVSLVSAENTPLLDTVDRIGEKHRVGLSAEQEHMLESGAGVSDSLTSVQKVGSSGVAHGVRFHSVRLSPAQHQAQAEALHGQPLQPQVMGTHGLMWEAVKLQPQVTPTKHALPSCTFFGY